MKKINYIMLTIVIVFISIFLLRTKLYHIKNKIVKDTIISYGESIYVKDILNIDSDDILEKDTLGSYKYTYENEYDKEILIREEGNNDYKLIETKVGNYDAFLVAIYDPSKIHVVTKTKLGAGAYGENMVSMCKRTKSKVCINAGRFKQDSYGLSSDYPVGYIIKDSEIIWATDSNRKGELIGFNKDNMPIGLHIIGDSFEEAKMYQLAAFIEKKLNLDLNAKEVK